MPFFGLDRLTNKSALRAEGISGIVVLGDVHGDVIQDPAQHAGRLQLRWDQLRVDQREIAWLSWRTRLSDLVGRESEKDEILLWAKEGDGVRARFVTGEGGVGKTRLAAEVAQALRDEPDGWAAGFAHQSQAGAWFTKPGGTLIILDYPEENRASVERIVEDLATFDVADRIRILFLSRRGLDYWKDTIVRATFFDREPIVLDSLEDDAAYEVYLSAQNRVPLARPRDPCRVTKDEFIDWLGRAPAHQRPLFIAAAAIHSVAHPETSVVNLAGNEVMMALVQRELGRLKRESTSNGLNDQTLGRLTAIAAVAGPLDAASLRNFADADLDLGLPPANRIVDEINRTGRLFDGLVLPPEPDILAAGLVVETFRANTAMAPEWLWAAFSAGGIERAAGRFARLAHDAETVLDILDWRLGNVLKEAVEGSIERCQSLRSAVMDPNLPQGLCTGRDPGGALGSGAAGESESAVWPALSVDAGSGSRAPSAAGSDCRTRRGCGRPHGKLAK